MQRVVREPETKVSRYTVEADKVGLERPGFYCKRNNMNL
jgi:hypothetical protein